MRQLQAVFSPKFAFAATLAAFLAGCGGGEDEPDTAPPPTPSPTTSASAEGVYGGNLSGAGTNNTILALVLENGELWSLYGNRTPAGVLSIEGFVRGTGTSSNGKYDVSDAVNFSALASTAGTLASSYDAVQKSIKGTFTFGSTIWTAEGQSLGDGYDYSVPALQADVTGDWTVTTLAGDRLSFTVAADGKVTLPGNGDCSAGGKLEPRVTNKNVYDFALAFSISPSCSRTGQAFYGVAVSFKLPDGQRQLIVAGREGTQHNMGLAAVGLR